MLKKSWRFKKYRFSVKEKLKEDNVESDITTTSLCVSLICPLSKIRMSSPCRSTTCNHLQCFDAKVFLELNRKKLALICPVCHKPFLYDDLFIDG